MPANLSPEKIEELRVIFRQLAPYALNLVHAFKERDPDAIANAAVEVFLNVDKLGIMD